LEGDLGITQLSLRAFDLNEEERQFWAASKTDEIGYPRRLAGAATFMPIALFR
jgi:hypothetical protein